MYSKPLPQLTGFLWISCMKQPLSHRQVSGFEVRLPVLLLAEIFRRVSASASTLELRQSSSNFDFQGDPLGSSGSPAALRRQST